MPNFRLTKDGSAGRYYVAWGEGRRTRRRSMGTTDQALAQERMKAFVHRMTSTDDEDDRPVHLVLTQYWDDVAGEARSAETAKRSFDHFLDYYGLETTVSQINKTANKQYEKDMRERGWGSATINRARNFLRAALNHAVANGDLKFAPHIPTLPVTTKKERWLTRSEAARLLWACRKARFYYLRLFILIGLYTAARHEAILSLRWDQVDFEGGRIDFRRYDKKGNLLPETNKKRPNAPAPDRLIRFLRWAYKRELRSAKKEKRAVIPFVIHHRHSQVLSVKKAFAEAVRRAKLKHVTPHTLKHTRITWLLRAHVPVWQVSGLTATSVATITRVYGHHIPDDLKLYANADTRAHRTHKAPISQEKGSDAKGIGAL
jgi:integrase